MLYTLGDVCLHIALLLNVLRTPVYIVLAEATARNIEAQLTALEDGSTLRLVSV